MSKIVDYKIVISENANTSEVRAASFVRSNIKLVCGKTLPVVRDSEVPTDLEIIVGKTNREALDGVEQAEASHEKGIATVTLSAPVSDETLKKAVEDEGYTVLG